MITNTCIIAHYSVDRVDAGSVVSDIRIGNRPCHFLDIWYQYRYFKN